MKKHLLLLFLFVLYNRSVQAQNTLKTGLAYTQFGKDRQNGIGYFTEYNHQLSRVLSLAPSLQMAYGTKGQEFPYYLLNKFAAGLDLTLFYTPIHFGKIVVKLGAGPSLRYFSGRDQSYYEISTNGSGITNLGPDGLYWVPFFNPIERLKPHYVTIGYSGVLEGAINLSSHWQSAIRFTYQGYSSRDYITAVGLNMGYLF